MIRTAAQVTQAGKLSARYHREVIRRDGREFRFLAMAPIPTRRARNDGAESYRWLTDGRSLLLVRGPAGKPTVVDENTTYATATKPQPIRGPAGKPTVVDENTTYATATKPQPIRGARAYPANADTALTASDWTLGKDDPDPRTGERVYYGEALEVNGEWWRFWALAPVGAYPGGKRTRWFTNGRQFGLVTGPQGKGTLVRVMT